MGDGRAPFRFLRDRFDRCLHRAFPDACHERTPPLAHHPKVGTQFAPVGEVRSTLDGTQLKRLRYFRHGPAHQPEFHPRRAFEANGLDGCRCTKSCRRAMRRQHHVRATLQDLQLVSHRARSPPEIRRRDNVEHLFRRRREIAFDRSQRAPTTTNMYIYDHQTARHQRQAADNRRGT